MKKFNYKLEFHTDLTFDETVESKLKEKLDNVLIKELNKIDHDEEKCRTCLYKD